MPSTTSPSKPDDEGDDIQDILVNKSVRYKHRNEAILRPSTIQESSAENVDAAPYAYSDTSTDTELETPTRSHFVEDTSAPDEDELKEIEAHSERSAADRKYMTSISGEHANVLSR